ncbi:MAG: hypothetical protein ACRCTY_06720 [Candidatus Adiutrix sp.]
MPLKGEKAVKAKILITWCRKKSKAMARFSLGNALKPYYLFFEVGLCPLSFYMSS